MQRSIINIAGLSILSLILGTLAFSFSRSSFAEHEIETIANKEQKMPQTIETATFGGGCFWCTEAVFQSLIGVQSAKPGYAGGSTEAPTYEEVSDGDTGHAEVVQVTFDPSKLTYAELLEVFFHTHDPTTLNRQGADSGTQYRSIILYHDEKQKGIAQEVIKKISADKLWPAPIVTELKPFEKFYEAENYHHDYYKRNKDKPYCSLVIAPKLQKLYKDFASKLK